MLFQTLCRKRQFHFVIFFALIILHGCAGTQEKKSSGTERRVEIRPGCYMLTIMKDTARLKMEINNDSVSGSLVYQRFEKDGNKGTISGKIVYDTIDAWYHFQSEGVFSYRQLKLLVTKEGLIEGYGDLDASGDSAFFKYPHTLTFEPVNTFVPTNCP